MLTLRCAVLLPWHALAFPQGERYRVAWEWLHKSVGRVCLLLALANISLGVMFAVSPTAVWAVWFALLGCYVVAAAVLEALLWRRRRRGARQGGLKVVASAASAGAGAGDDQDDVKQAARLPD